MGVLGCVEFHAVTIGVGAGGAGAWQGLMLLRPLVLREVAAVALEEGMAMNAEAVAARVPWAWRVEATSQAGTIEAQLRAAIEAAKVRAELVVQFFKNSPM